jgi:hypothetical protein
LSEVGESFNCVASHNRASPNAILMILGTIMCSWLKLVNRSMASRARFERHKSWCAAFVFAVHARLGVVSQTRPRGSQGGCALGLKLVNRSMTSRAQAELHRSEFETLGDDVLLSKVGESFDRFVALTMGYSVVLVALVEHVRFLDRIIRLYGQGRPSATPARL